MGVNATFQDPSDSDSTRFLTPFRWTVSDRLLRFGHAHVAGSQVAVLALRNLLVIMGTRSILALQGLLNDPGNSFRG